MKSESITIIIPIPNKVLQPNYTVGSFGGRMMVAAARKRIKKLVVEAIENENIETAPWVRAEVTAKFYFETNRIRDTDNATGSLKSAYDGLVCAKLLENDDPKHLRRPAEPEFLVDKVNPRVELTITRIL
jgi:hypothetical protein